MKKMLPGKSLLLACLLFTYANGWAQVTQKWVQRENGDPNTRSQANDLVVDCNNNIIVTGSAVGTGDRNDFITIKYNDEGDTKWVKKYNGPGNHDDAANAVAADRQGNVYVTGSSVGNGTELDYTTIKYNDDGDTKWVKRYSGSENQNDEAKAIAVDDEGNVYVTGYAFHTGTSFDYTTIKYDKDGNTLWIRNYNGPGNGGDFATAIAIDNLGNVYVTGYSRGTGSDDYATVKYNAHGDLLWVSRYNSAFNRFDKANALAVDALGNVYVTGVSTVASVEGYSYTDIATVKYNASGIQQWASTYDRLGHDEANTVAVDGSGNVYVAGFSGGIDEDPDNDYTTIKYNAAGAQQWVGIYASPGIAQNGGVTGLVLDANANVYITGGLAIESELDYATIKYNTNGVQQWVAVYDGPGNENDKATAIGMDSNGNVYVTGWSGIDIFTPQIATIKYTANGVRKWIKRYNGQNDLVKGDADFANALALGTDGNVHVTGGISRNFTGLDYNTFKYDTNDGNRIWKKTYNGAGNGPDQGRGIAVDANGNVYITGISDGLGTHEDYATVKYDKYGNSLWGKRYNGPGNGYDAAAAIAIDQAGNVYVTGQSAGIGNNADYATIKYDASGNVKWVKRYNGPGNSIDMATAIAVDQNGNVYVTGWSWGGSTFQDYATIKYDANGNQLWVARFDGAGSDQANALAVDASGNVYVTGYSNITEFAPIDYLTIKYNAGGVQQWNTRYAGLGNNSDEARDIAVDALGNVYVTGASEGDYGTIKYNTAGVQQWVARYNSNLGDEANALALDAGGNVYVTGASGGDYGTVKYNAAGEQQWVARYNGPGNGEDVATDIKLDAAGNVYVTGRSTGIGTRFDYATIKYEQTPLVTTRSVTAPAVIGQREIAKLSVKAFPNAFTQYINLQWSGSDKPVNITITDAMGRLVEKRTGLAPSGVLKTGNNFPQGVYYAEIVQGTEKMLLKLVKN